MNERYSLTGYNNLISVGIKYKHTMQYTVSIQNPPSKPSQPKRNPSSLPIETYENITALGSNGLPVLGSIPFFSILTAFKILLASSNPTFLIAIILLIAALSLSSRPLLESPNRMLSVKSKFELEKPASKSAVKEPGRKRRRGVYEADREKKDLICVREGMRGTQ